MRKLALRTALLAAPLLAAWLWCSAASAAVINATFDSNYTAERLACAQAAIDQWEATILDNYEFEHVRMLIMDLSFIGNPLAATNISTGGYQPRFAAETLLTGSAGTGGAGQFGPVFPVIPWDSNTYITVALNSNYVGQMYFGVSGPVPGGQYDALTLFRHELGHGVGFAEEYTAFAAKLTPGPGSDRTYNGNGFTVEITPVGQGTHVLDSADLMSPTLGTGVRQDVSSDPDLRVLSDAYGYVTPEPATLALMAVGVVAGLVARRRRAA